MKKGILFASMIFGVSGFSMANEGVEITKLRLNDLPKTAQECFDKTSKTTGFVSVIGAINNNGNVAGSMAFNESVGAFGKKQCVQKSFIWDNGTKTSFNVLPYLHTGFKTKVKGANTASISTNQVVSGITFATTGGRNDSMGTYYKFGKAHEVVGQNYAWFVSQRTQL